MRTTPENTFILFIFRVCKFWRGEKNDENTANAALNLYFKKNTANYCYSTLLILSSQWVLMGTWVRSLACRTEQLNWAVLRIAK